MGKIRGVARSLAILFAVVGVMAVSAGTATATPDPWYHFSKTTMSQSFGPAACPSWVSFPASCLDIEVTGTDNEGAAVSSTAVVALETDGTRAERRGVFETPLATVPFTAKGTYNPADGTATYNFLHQNGGESLVHLSIVVGVPTSYDPATQTGGGPETWWGKILV